MPTVRSGNIFTDTILITDNTGVPIDPDLNSLSISIAGTAPAITKIAVGVYKASLDVTALALGTYSFSWSYSVAGVPAQQAHRIRLT